jgi:hypothetical protein
MTDTKPRTYYQTFYQLLFTPYDLYKMERPCAYCKEFGHHIRYCSLLDDKKRSQTPNAMRVMVPTSTRKVTVTSNMFATIYSSSSSDDEVEDGEIVEEDRVRPQLCIDTDIDIDISDSESSHEPIVEPKWTRSHIKVKHTPITIPQPLPVVHIQPEYKQPVYTEEQMAEYIAMMERFKGYKGRSWAEINYEIEEMEECNV